MRNHRTQFFLFSAGSVIFCTAGLISILSVWGSLTEEWNDNRDPVELPINSIKNEYISEEVFLSGELHGNGEILRDPLFPVEVAGLYFQREVKVFYVRSQTSYTIVDSDPVIIRGRTVNGNSGIYSETGEIAAFGRQLEDSMQQPLPGFVRRIESIFEDFEIRPEKTVIGKYFIQPHNMPDFYTSELEPVKISESLLNRQLASAQGSTFKSKMKEFDWQGITVLEDEPSCLLLYRKSITERFEGDTKICFSFLPDQNAGVYAVLAENGELIPAEYERPDPARNPALEPELKVHIQLDEYQNFEDFRTDILYTYNHWDMKVYGCAGFAAIIAGLILLYMAVMTFRRIKSAGG